MQTSGCAFLSLKAAWRGGRLAHQMAGRRRGAVQLINQMELARKLRTHHALQKALTDLLHYTLAQWLEASHLACLLFGLLIFLNQVSPEFPSGSTINYCIEGVGNLRRTRRCWFSVNTAGEMETGIVDLQMHKAVDLLFGWTRPLGIGLESGRLWGPRRWL